MPNYTGATTGALSGASTGATIGSVIPGVGTAIGAGVGAIAGGLGGLFGGKKKKKQILSSLDKRQNKINKAQFKGLMGEGGLADLYNYNPEAANAVFDKTIANPAYRNFKEKLAPEITGQFRNAGLMNSSYAGDALSRLARDVQEGLDAQRTKYLYGAESEARQARREGVENIQNRQTFAYDKSARPSSGFDIDAVLKSITPEMTDQLTQYFKPTTGTT